MHKPLEDIDEIRGRWAICAIALLAICVFAIITGRDNSHDSHMKARQQQIEQERK